MCREESTVIKKEERKSMPLVDIPLERIVMASQEEIVNSSEDDVANNSEDDSESEDYKSPDEEDDTRRDELLRIIGSFELGHVKLLEVKDQLNIPLKSGISAIVKLLKERKTSEAREFIENLEEDKFIE